jgi:hypothetical protein
MDLSLLIKVGAPEARTDRLSVEEKVEACLDLIDSGHESRSEWQYIRKLNNYLMNKCNLSSREERILRTIQPIMEKYGQMSPLKTEQKAEYHSATESEK